MGSCFIGENTASLMKAGFEYFFTQIVERYNTATYTRCSFFNEMECTVNMFEYIIVCKSTNLEVFRYSISANGLKIIKFPVSYHTKQNRKEAYAM